jgi:hypothetical protein
MAAADAGDVKTARDLTLLATEFLAAAAERERLTSGSRSGNLDPMLAAARVRHSEGAESDDRKVRAFLEIANDAGHTLRSVAEAVKRSHGKGSHVYLLKALRGEKAIRLSWAKTIQGLTKSIKNPKGFEASAKNWPGGWARED